MAIILNKGSSTYMTFNSSSSYIWLHTVCSIWTTFSTTSVEVMKNVEEYFPNVRRKHVWNIFLNNNTTV